MGGSKAAKVRAATTFTLHSLHDQEFKLPINALVLARLTSQLPSREIHFIDFDIFEGLTLADPRFHVPNSVDLILGADVYGKLLRIGVRSFPPTDLVAQASALGWIVSGSVQEVPSRRAEHDVQALHIRSADDKLSEHMQRFWETTD